jgi:hypothetical protein
MARRFVIGAFGIVTLAFLAVTGARSTAISADDAAGKKDGNLVARLENRITALEKRIAVLEKQRDRGETKFLAQPVQRIPHMPQPPSFDGNWCYTILIDNNGQTAQAQRPQTQR